MSTPHQITLVSAEAAGAGGNSYREDFTSGFHVISAASPYGYPEPPRGILSSGDVERRLAAILAADVAGSCRLIRIDEEGTLAQLKALRKTLFDPKIIDHRGRIVKNTGDGALVEFASVVDAVRCADDIQRGLAEQNTHVPLDKRIEFRIGIHLGDIIVGDHDIFGDGVNIAVRLEGIAEPGGICMSDDAYRQVRGKVEIPWEDLGPQSLKNIAEPLRAWRTKAGAPSAATAQPASLVGQAPPLGVPEKPSIAVLPFQNISADPEQEYFADGLVEDIITALSQFKSLFVIARNSSFTYKGKAVDIKQVGRELGVRYVLEGSVRKAGSRLRITGQLIDSATGSHLWAEKIDGALEDVFDLQDKVASSVAGVINPVLEDAEIKRALDRPTADLTSYDLYLRALPLWRAWARECTMRAITLLERAIERDPHYGPALAALALCHSQDFVSGWSEDSAAKTEQGKAVARQALEAAPDDTFTVALASLALMILGENTRVLQGLVDNALARNPSSATGWLSSGWMHACAGEADVAIAHLEKSLRLDPRTKRRAFHLTGIGICHFHQRRFDQAAAVLEASFHELPTFTTTMWFLAACYAQMGRLDDAREFAARHGILPGGRWLRIASMFGTPERREFLISGLRLAAGETGVTNGSQLFASGAA